MVIAASQSVVSAADRADRRLLGGLLVSLLLHALVLLLQFGVPGMGTPGATPPLSVRIASLDPASTPAPPQPSPTLPPPEPTLPLPAVTPPPASGMRLVDPVPVLAPVVPPPAPPAKAKPKVSKGAPRRARRISPPLPARETLEEPTKVIAQNATVNEFALPIVRPEEAEQKTLDIKDAQVGDDDGDAATSAALEAEAAVAGRLKAEEEAQALTLAEEQARVAAEESARVADEAEKQRLAREQDARKLAEAEDAERQQAAAQQAREQSEQDAARLKTEQLAQQKAELQRLEQQKAEQVAAEQRRVEQTRVAQAEQLRADQQRAEQQQVEQQRAEQLRLAQQRAEQKKLEQQRAEQQIAEQQRAEQQRAEQQRAEQQRAEQQRAEQQRADAAKRQAAQAAAARDPLQPGAGSGGRSTTPGGAGPAGASGQLPRNALGSDLANRARDLVKGLDVLKGAPPGDPLRDGRRVAVGANERDLSLRMYVESWRQKIERNASVNFPRNWVDQEKKDPLVSVAVRSDGSVDEVTIITSSGRADMDEAVRRIVRVNARYSAFPAEIAKKYDVIDIRRVWRFDEALKLMEEVR